MLISLKKLSISLRCEINILNILGIKNSLLERSGSGLAFCQLLVRSQKAGPAPRYTLNSESGNARLLTLFKNKQ
ncbi:TPA: hypothetical protein JBJ19_08065 [Legionella pneumophila]|nr:hypothetical protein [Legionella pneumophila]HAU1604791.1 hypothetical protein [Legionella pneumophila]HAU1846613.1 hypothetical protein [Legionella pneumophila]